MPKGDWWFKFEYTKWDDELLKKCSLETQGFWLKAYALMRKTDTYKLVASIADFARMFSCSEVEVERSVNDLKRTKAADVNFKCNASVTLCNAPNVTCNDVVTLVSRERKSALSAREKTRLRVRKLRGNADVTVVKRDRVKSKSNKKEEEAISEANASALHEDVWSSFRVLLQQRGESEKTARSKIGKLVKKHGKEKIASAWNSEKVRVEESQEPFAYFSKLLDGYKHETDFAKKLKAAKYQHFQVYGNLDYEVPFTPERYGIDAEEYARYSASH